MRSESFGRLTPEAKAEFVVGFERPSNGASKKKAPTKGKGKKVAAKGKKKAPKKATKKAKAKGPKRKPATAKA